MKTLRYDEERSKYFKCVINSIFTSFLNVKLPMEMPTHNSSCVSVKAKQVFLFPDEYWSGNKTLLILMNKLIVISLARPIKS